MEWFALGVYLGISGWTYVGMLRLSSRRYGVSWFDVLWSLFAFIPLVGQIILFLLWLTESDFSPSPIGVPRWLRRLAGDE